MKKSLPLFLSTCLLLLFACNRPMKLLDKGKSKKALKASMNRLKHGKVKDDHLYVFEKAFLRLTENDAKWVARMRQHEHPAIWIDIYKKAKAIDKRQRKVQAINNRLQHKGYHPSLDFYPASALIEEARDNVALYYYAKAQEFIPAARSNDRKAARKAFHWLSEIEEYRTGFRDTDFLLREMRAIGTTHILLNPIEGYARFDGRLYDEFFRHEYFPKRLDWEVLHLGRPKQEEIDYRLDMIFDRVYVSWENVTSNACTNTVQVQEGYQEVKVWNAQDSAYVTERRPIYVDVSVTVNTYTQEKYAELRLQANLIEAASNQEVDYFRLSHRENWENQYSEVCGDERALSNTCNTQGGSECFFPSDRALLINSARALNHRFYRLVDRKFEL